MQKKDNYLLREEIFRHLDGIVTAPTAFALHEKGVLAHLLQEKEADLQDLTAKFKANEGYLNVALRVLCSQGWLSQQLDNQKDTIRYATTETSETAFALVPCYADVVHLLKLSEKYHNRRFEVEPFRVLKSIFENTATTTASTFPKMKKSVLCSTRF